MEENKSDQLISAHNEAPNSNAMDFTDEKTRSAITDAIVGGVYDPRPVEDGARRIIAYLLIGLLWLIVAVIFILLGFSAICVEDLKEFGVILSPIIALVSAATGFYYGTKTS